MGRKERGNAYILILPSLFTTGNLFCGFYSIVHSMHHDVLYAAYAIIIAGIFDVLDGRVARILKGTSRFGVEYDSIADVVSFGIAPALLVYAWVLEPFGRIGWAGAFFFAACGALRLARFNANSEEAPKSYFVGLPIPAAANCLATLVIADNENPLPFNEDLALPFVFCLGFLMVSTIRYRSFKDFDLRRRSFFWLVLLVALIAFMAVRPEQTMACLLLYYVAWGPLRELVRAFLKVISPRKEGVVSNALSENKER